MFLYAVHQDMRAQPDGGAFVIRVVPREKLTQVCRHVLQQPARNVQGEYRGLRTVRAQAALPAQPQPHGIDDGQAQEVGEVQIAGESPESHGAAPVLREPGQLGGDSQERPVAAAEDVPLLYSDAVRYGGRDVSSEARRRQFVDPVQKLLLHLLVAVYLSFHCTVLLF